MSKTRRMLLILLGIVLIMLSLYFLLFSPSSLSNFPVGVS